jgi:fatty acid desaturase
MRRDQLAPGLREEIRALHQIESWRHLKLLVLVALWLGPGALAVTVASWPLRAVCWLVMGLALHGIGVFMHEGAHHNLLRKPVLDRTIGFLCGVPVLFSCSCYRATHSLHHRYENTARDPDNLAALVPNPTLRGCVGAVFLVVGSLLYTLLLAIMAPTRATGRDRWWCLLEISLLATIYSVVAAWCRQDPVIWSWVTYGWLGGLLVAVPIANVRGLAEHSFLRHDDPPHPLRSTRSLPSHRLVAFFFNNQNYHLEHHLFPRVPWYNLPRLHQLLQDVYRREGAAVLEGYQQFAVDVARAGFIGVR